MPSNSTDADGRSEELGERFFRPRRWKVCQQVRMSQFPGPSLYFVQYFAAAAPVGRRQDQRQLEGVGLCLYASPTAKLPIADNFPDPAALCLIDFELACQPRIEGLRGE